MFELDFAINTYGCVEDTHAVRYREFGDWIRQCYSQPVAAVNSTRSSTSSSTISNANAATGNGVGSKAGNMTGDSPFVL